LIEQCPVNQDSSLLTQDLPAATSNVAAGRSSSTNILPASTNPVPLQLTDDPLRIAPTPIAPTPIRNEILTPLLTPAPNLREALAALHTAGSIQTSGSDSMLLPQRVRPSTRASSPPEENDSDNEITDAEDEYEVDFNDNFWRNREELRELVDEEAVVPNEDDEAEDAVTCPPGADSCDYARLLKNVTEFQFREVSPSEAELMDDPPKIYDGESGLQRGVSSSFHTPFGSFRRSGFTEELVLRWTMNSNK
jgi:hypothetical protein